MLNPDPFVLGLLANTFSGGSSPGLWTASDLVKILTVGIFLTATALLYELPRRRSRAATTEALRKANAGLVAEIDTLRKAEQKLKDETVNLDRRLAECTATLDATHAELRKQIEEREKAQVALRESEGLFSQAFRHSPDCISIVRLSDRTVIQANEAMCIFWGSTPEKVIGRPTWDYAQWCNEEERGRFVQALQETGECLNHETNMRLKDGRVVRFNVSSRLISINGESCALTVMHDVTERKKAEVAAAQLAAIVEFTEDGIIGKNLEGIVTSWNSGAERIFGYRADEMIGQSILRLLPPDRFDEEAEILKGIKRGESGRHFETVRVRKDGGSIFVSVTVSSIKNAAGEVIGASKIARDITAQKRLAEERVKLARLIEHSGDFIAMADLEGRITFLNSGARKMIGYDPTEDPQNLLFTDYVPSKWQDFFRETVLPTVREKGLWEGEMQLKNLATGALVDVFRSTFVLRDSTGKPDSYATVTRDITDRKEAEEKINRLNADLEKRVVERTAQLEAANRELEAFSYSVSHDLRSPLRAVDGFSQAVLEDFGPLLPAEGQRQLRTIRASAQRMGHLIDDLLTFSRLSRQPLQRQAVDTNALVRTVIDDLQQQARERSITIRCGSLAQCFGDPALIRQVWVNLLTNAFKYTGKTTDPQVEIGSITEAGETRYFVRDNGIGFDMRYAGKLFGVFQRLHRLEDYEGTGVGLAIVQRVVHRHGGRVWAEAKPNEGALFQFTLGPDTLS